MEPQGYVLFHEEQRFTQVWLWLVIISSSVLMIGLFTHAMIEQLYHGRPWGDNAMPDPVLWITGPLMILFGIVMLFVFLKAKLIIDIRENGVFFNYSPFHRQYRRVDLDDVTKMEAVKYRPILDYGGWGIRYGKTGRGYNVTGNRGVLFTYSNGKTLLLGSRQPEQLSQSIQKLMK